MSSAEQLRVLSTPSPHEEQKHDGSNRHHQRNKSDNEEDDDDEEYMIGLYYCYTAVPINNVKRHVAFQKESCASRDLMGRIRVSPEGINGVLSGRHVDLRSYEHSVRDELLALIAREGKNSAQKLVGENAENGNVDRDNVVISSGSRNAHVKREELDLDIKYCRLRPDVPREKQLFDSLCVRATREIVSLYEPTPEEQRRMVPPGRRHGRRIGGRNKFTRGAGGFVEREDKKGSGPPDPSRSASKPSNLDSCQPSTECELTESLIGKAAPRAEHEQLADLEFVHDENASSPENDGVESKDRNKGEAVPSSVIPKSPHDIDLEKYPPATHLSPREWNEYLLSFSSSWSRPAVSGAGAGAGGGGGASVPPPRADPRNGAENGGEEPTCAFSAVTASKGNDTKHGKGKDSSTGDKTPPPDMGRDAILIDARNVYESRVGRFSVPGVPTLLTNTRKYSSLPAVLESSMSHLAGRNVFMYCTGGVRCERASAFLRALSESDRWEGEKPGGIYQLRGGIQRYLEQYGTPITGGGVAESRPDDLRVVRTRDVANPKNDRECDGTNRETPSRTSSKTPRECLYRGKNFVFDQRRTDPVVGRDATGRCLLCDIPHDDYDNGHAPCDNLEARCCRCRVLVLVCNECRTTVRCFGEHVSDEEKDGEGNGTNVDNSFGRATTKKRDLFCGPGGLECVDEGNPINFALVSE